MHNNHRYPLRLSHHNSLCCHLFGEAWRDFAAPYVDDLLIHGTTYEQCKLRQQMFMQGLRALGKELSLKIEVATKGARLDSMFYIFLFIHF